MQSTQEHCAEYSFGGASCTARAYRIGYSSWRVSYMPADKSTLQRTQLRGSILHVCSYGRSILPRKSSARASCMCAIRGAQNTASGEHPAQQGHTAEDTASGEHPARMQSRQEHTAENTALGEHSVCAQQTRAHSVGYSSGEHPARVQLRFCNRMCTLDRQRHQIRPDQVRSGQVRSGQVRSDQVRSDQIRSNVYADAVSSIGIRSNNILI
jgi:hypothetical protein